MNVPDPSGSGEPACCQGGGTKLGFGFIFGLAVALWSANAGMKAIMDALNVVYEEKEKRGFIKLNLISLAFTIAAIVSVSVSSWRRRGSSGGAQLSRASKSDRAAVSPCTLAALAADSNFRSCRTVPVRPSRREPRWQWISVGSAFAAVAWLISSALLSWYLASFADYDATYGSLGAGIGMMMWMWISAIVILFGAQLNSEIEHQTARDFDSPRRETSGCARAPSWRIRSGRRVGLSTQRVDRWSLSPSILPF